MAKAALDSGPEWYLEAFGVLEPCPLKSRPKRGRLDSLAERIYQAVRSGCIFIGKLTFFPIYQVGGTNMVSKRFFSSRKFISIVIAAIIVASAVSIVSILVIPRSKNENNVTSFISSWDTAMTSPGYSASNQVHLPLVRDGTYNFSVQWGDESNDLITSWNQTATTHAYASAGNYTITMNGTMIGWCFNNGGDRLKLLDIKQWGSLQLGNSGGYFYRLLEPRHH